MAYVDQNGLVQIDEIEAAQDVRKLLLAKESLYDVLETISQILGINSEFQGNTATAIETSAGEIRTHIDVQISSIEEAINFINQTVENYKLIDEKMKNQVNTSLS